MNLYTKLHQIEDMVSFTKMINHVELEANFTKELHGTANN